MDKKEVDRIICYETKPIYIGGEIKGYFIETDSLKNLLEALKEDS